MRGTLLALTATVAAAQTWNGAAIDARHIYAWGDRVTEWTRAGARSREVARPRSVFAEGGCLDRGTLILQDGTPLGDLVRVDAAGRRTVLDRGVQMHDCRSADLFGRHGVLAVYRGAQVRFYYEGGMQEVYSFYTASNQGGLLERDIDGDGRADLVAGNYWIRRPEAFDLPWRLFAINTRHETPESATFSTAWLGRELIAAQGHMAEGKVFRYAPPADVRQLWPETAVATLRFPHAVASTSAGVVVAENAGPGSRVVLIAADGAVRELGACDGAHTALPAGSRVALVGSRRIQWIDAPAFTVTRRRNEVR